MTYFAHINNGTVDSVIVIRQQTLQENNGWYCPSCGSHKPLNEWVETDKTGDMKRNPAVKGGTYDVVRDVFIPPKPFNSWILDEDTLKYKAPKEEPKDGLVRIWSEEDEDWVIVTHE